jgi:methionine-rich copper-binding protein CopC
VPRFALRSAAACFLVLGALAASPAAAHPGDGEAPGAISAEPRPWLAVTEEPEEVTIVFSAEVADVAAHRIEVVDPTGKRVDTGPVRRMGSAELAVELDDVDRAGLYTVRWTALLAGHLARGEYGFSYEPPEQRIPDVWLASGALSAAIVLGGGIALRRQRDARTQGR